MDTEPIIEPAPPTTPANFAPKRPPKLLYLFGGVAVILFSIALAVSFVGKNKSSTSSSAPQGDQSATSTSQSKYSNPKYFYELTLPVGWVEIKHSPINSNVAIFSAGDSATFELSAVKTTLSLDEYLVSQDEASKDVIKSKSAAQVKVGEYDGYERQESWPVDGLQTIATYVKISDMLYIYILTPASGKNSISNESIIRDYHLALSSFHLTSTAGLGQDLKNYQSKKVAGLAFTDFSLKYPQTWVLSEKLGENSLDVSIYRNNYELTISQKAVGGAVCLFSDSPAFEGSSGDLRGKQFAEFNTTSGAVLRRYFNVNSGEKSSMFFCEKQTDGPYFQTPISIGGLAYYVPAKYDSDIIKEMDEIVKSIVTTP